MNVTKEIKWRIRAVKAAARKQKMMVVYAVKMLTMPKGTTFEIDSAPVDRVAYVAETLKLLRQL